MSTDGSDDIHDTVGVHGSINVARKLRHFLQKHLRLFLLVLKLLHHRHHLFSASRATKTREEK
jgi:hypothetical protein